MSPTTTVHRHCTPCRVTIQGATYRIYTNGVVYRLHRVDSTGEFTEEEFPLLASEAQDIRHAASRLRRNRAARERHAALRSLGMVKTPGVPGGWE